MTRLKNWKTAESGFTLIEIIVSTGIFVTVLTSMLTLFNYTLQINRRVQALREVVQGTRTFAETLTREVRNGRIDYSSWTTECDASLYASATNKSLGILTKSGDKLCFYFLDKDLYLKKLTAYGETNSKLFNSPNFSVDVDSFSFTIRPTVDPNTAPFPQVQPYVSIVGKFTVNKSGATPSTINYQTTISTDVYDTRK